MESVILSSPVLLCGYAAAFALCVFSVIKKPGFAVTAISVLLFVATSIYALLLGAQLTEVAVCAVALFIVSIIPIWRGSGDK